MLALFFWGEIFFHRSNVHAGFYKKKKKKKNLGSFSCTSRAGLIFMWGVSVTHTVLALFLSGEFLLHMPCCLLVLSGEFLLHIPCWLLVLSGEFHFHISCLLYFYAGSFSYTTHAGFFFFFFFYFIFIWGVSLTHAVLASFLSGKFHLLIPCWLHFSLGSFSYTSYASFIITREFRYTSRAVIYIYLYIYIYLGCFSYTIHHGFIFMLGVSLTHPVLALILSGDFLLHITCWLHFYLGSFSYTSRAGFIFMWRVSLTHPSLASFLCGEFLLHIPC